MLELLGIAAAVHVVPNALMKVVKKTKVGHALLTASFAVGLELARMGRKLNPSIKDAMTYGFGPESLVEYELGFNLGIQISCMSEDEQEIFLANMVLEINASLSQYTEEEISELEATPGLGTIISFAKGEWNDKFEEILMVMSCIQDEGRSVKGVATNVGVLATLCVIEPHVIIQPIICMIRKKVAESVVGRRFLENSFKKGQSGEIVSKSMRGAIDMIVSPSALDTMRLGHVLTKYGITIV